MCVRSGDYGRNRYDRQYEVEITGWFAIRLATGHGNGKYARIAPSVSTDIDASIPSGQHTSFDERRNYRQTSTTFSNVTNYTRRNPYRNREIGHIFVHYGSGTD
jgi:hypothetical protein